MGNNNSSVLGSDHSYLAGYIIDHRAELLGYANKLTHYNTDDAKDLFQETVYRSLRYAELYHEQGATDAWLRTIMRNIYINEVNSAANRTSVDADSYEMVDETLSPDESYSIGELYAAIEKLPPRDAEIITMRLQGHSYAEIAVHLSMKDGTIKSSLHRIKSQLKQLLE